MEYKNLDLHNIGHIEHTHQGLTWLRIPREVYDALESDMGQAMARNAIGVELRFVIRSGQAKIVMRSKSDPRFLTTLHVHYGGLQGGWDAHEMNSHIPTTPTEFVFSRPGNMDTLQAISKQAGLPWDPEVVRVVLERGDIELVSIEGDIAPPKKHQMPSKTLLTYGSSITHGSNALSIDYSWPSIVAHRLKTDLLNLGMAGSCRMEPKMVEHIAAMGEADRWHMAILELGINVLDWDESLIRRRVEHTLQQVAGRNKAKPVVVISPFYSIDDFLNKGNAAKWRRVLREVIGLGRHPNVHFIDGLELLGEMSLIAVDEVHPSIHGMMQIADRLYARIANFMP